MRVALLLPGRLALGHHHHHHHQGREVEVVAEGVLAQTEVVAAVVEEEEARVCFGRRSSSERSSWLYLPTRRCGPCRVSRAS
jgi:hypothetical protein